MSSLDDNSFSNHTDKLTVITDSDGIPVKVDNNPAHFDGFVQEIEDFSRRTGVFLPYFEHGMVMRGSKTITDSAASVPFLMGMVTNAKVYSARDPCPPTAKRVVDHNNAMQASTPQGAAVTPQTSVPTDVSRHVTDFETLEAERPQRLTRLATTRRRPRRAEPRVSGRFPFVSVS